MFFIWHFLLNLVSNSHPPASLYSYLIYLTAAKTFFYKEKLEAIAEYLHMLYNIFFFPPPLKIGKICQSFTPTPIPTLHFQDAPPLSLTHLVLYCNSTTCLLDPILPLHSFSPSFFYHQWLNRIWSYTNCIQDSKGYSHHEKTHSGYLRHQYLQTGITSL